MSSNILAKAYAGKRVLITGHTGFKGSWLAAWLTELGAEVIGYALNPSTERGNFVLSGIGKRIDDIRGDVRDYEKLCAVIKEQKPEFVFHLAAQAIVRESYKNPKETYDINAGGTVNLLEACRQNDSVRVIVNITSDKCYENREWLWCYRENDPLGGYDPYSSSKGCAELITAAYRNSFFNPEISAEFQTALSSVRAGNVIGGGDWALDRIIPDCIRALEKDLPIVIRNPNAVRPWQFVLEPLGGYLLLGAKMADEPDRYTGAWNLGPESSATLTVREIADLLIRHWGRGSWENEFQENAVHEARLLALDISKARWQLGWAPVLNIDEAVGWTVDWYKACLSNQDLAALNRMQIHEYMRKMQIHDAGRKTD